MCTWGFAWSSTLASSLTLGEYGHYMHALTQSCELAPATGAGVEFHNVRPPPPLAAPLDYPMSPTTPYTSLTGLTSAAICASSDPRDLDEWWLELDGQRRQLPEQRLSEGHIAGGLECHAADAARHQRHGHGHGHGHQHRWHSAAHAGWTTSPDHVQHTRTGSWPAILRRNQVAPLQSSFHHHPYIPSRPLNSPLIPFDDHPMPHSHNIYESFDGDLFDGTTATTGDRERWRVSLSSLSSIRRSLSLNGNRHRTHHHYPYTQDAQTHNSTSGGQYIGSSLPLTSISRSVSSNEGSVRGGQSPRARPVSYASYAAPPHHYHDAPYRSGARPSSSYIAHSHSHSYSHTTPPSLPHSPVPSVDTYSALGSPTCHPHGPRTSPALYTHSNAHPPPPSIASVSAASAASTHHRLPPSGPSSPRPETMSYTSIPSTTLRLDGFDTRLFDGSSPSLLASPLPRIPSPTFGAGGNRASVISSVATESTASRSVRDSSRTTSPSLSSSTRARGPFHLSDEYSDVNISRNPVVKPNGHSLHNTFQTASDISPLTYATPLAPPPPLGADHVADLSPTLAPTTVIPATPITPPLNLRGGEKTPPSTARGAGSTTRASDSRAFNPSPNLSHSSRDPTPQGSVLSTPFEERDYYPPFGSLPGIPIHPRAGSFGVASGAGTATVKGGDNDRHDEHGMMHGGLHVHRQRGQRSPRPSPEPSPKAPHSQLQSDSRSIKSNKQRRPPMYDGGYGAVECYDSAPRE